MSLRPATSTDREKVFEWRNDPWLLSFSGSRRKVEWEEHDAWFSQSLDSEDRAIFIIESPKAGAVGSVRLDRDGESSATISVYVVKQHTGSGLGTSAISLACQKGMDTWPIDMINAYVRTDNVRSIRAFEKCGFDLSEIGPDVPEDHIKLTLHREVSN